MNSEFGKHEYQADFFQYINAGSTASAQVVCPLLVGWFKPSTLLDVGCGAGAWCRVWRESGVGDVIGVDGDYVDQDSLLMERSQFLSRDLSKSFDLNRRFDLVTSLEVAEHVSLESADAFVANLVRHGDCVLFSAAVPGQGGEFHVNEQPLTFWRKKFAEQGYRCFDPLRPLLRGMSGVEPWYRYNSLLYVKESLVAFLPEDVQRAEVLTEQSIAEFAPLSWRTRNLVLRNLPASLVERLVQVKHAWSRKFRPGPAT